MGVVNRKWMWLEYNGVDSVCGCKEVIDFLIKLLLIFSSHPYILFTFYFKMFVPLKYNMHMAENICCKIVI